MAHETETGGYGGEINDAAGAVVGEIGEGGLHEEDGTEDVDGVLAGEFFGGDGAEGPFFGDAGVVDDDVDLEFAAAGVGEVVFGGGY